MQAATFSAVMHKEGLLYVAECPEIGTVSQGSSIEEALANLKEATELYLEEFPPENAAQASATNRPQRGFSKQQSWVQRKGQTK